MRVVETLLRTWLPPPASSDTETKGSVLLEAIGD
jgi:hypothetical protein